MTTSHNEVMTYWVFHCLHCPITRQKSFHIKKLQIPDLLGPWEAGAGRKYDLATEGLLLGTLLLLPN